MRRSPTTPIRGTEGATLLDFWQWAYSDILSNRNRAVFAEFLVGHALDCLQVPRIEWDAVDLRYNGFRIEVKSAAAVQSWFQRRPSRVAFGIAGTTPERQLPLPPSVSGHLPLSSADMGQFPI